MDERRFTVARSDAGARIERLVMSELDCSRSEARALCDGNAVTLNGRRARKGDRAQAGDELLITFNGGWVVAQPELMLDVRLTRSELVVVSKPAGMPSAPLGPGERGTLVNALVARFPEMLGIGYTTREAGLLHRLDTETSGLLVAARTAACFRSLLAGLRSGELSKRYLAIVEGEGLPNAGTIDFPLAPHPNDPRKVAVAESGASYHHEAETRYHVLERGPRWALVELAAARAFRHQVRAHLAAIGHPIAGDVRYGGRSEARLGARHALHASRIEWAGRDVAPFSVVDEVPESFVSLLREDEKAKADR